jgi:phage shock protein PspC (stress-responsive transcriptional regulator)
MTHASGQPTRDVPYTITTDVSHLTEEDQEMIPWIQNAMYGIDVLFRRMTNQVGDLGSFVYDSARGCDFYPEGAPAEFDAYLASHEHERAALMNDLSVVRRAGDGFTAVPYAHAYAEDCELIARHLISASQTAMDPTFQHFLVQSARGFRTNDHNAADEAWVNVGLNLNGGPLELNIGFHESELDPRGIKRDPQAVFGLINRKETLKLRAAQAGFRNLDEGLGKRYGYEPNPSLVNMIAIDQLGLAGTALYTYIPAAFILPNSQEFRRTYGAKQVFCWDVLRARLDLVTRPIGQRVLPGEYQTALDPDLFKWFVTAHECGHGTSFLLRAGVLGPLATHFEEGRADTVGLYSILLESEDDPETRKRAELTTILHLVDGLRRIRFNIAEAHAVGTLLQYNWLINEGALHFKGNKLDFEPTLFLPAYEGLCEEFFRLHASGDPSAMAAFANTWGTPPDELPALVGQLTDLPRDLDPRFEITGLGSFSS